MHYREVHTAPAPLIENPTTGKVTLQEKGWFDYQIPPGGTSDTLAPGRARERVVLKALAGLGRLARMRTEVQA